MIYFNFLQINYIGFLHYFELKGIKNQIDSKVIEIYAVIIIVLVAHCICFRVCRNSKDSCMWHIQKENDKNFQYIYSIRDFSDCKIFLNYIFTKIQRFLPEFSDIWI